MNGLLVLACRVVDKWDNPVPAYTLPIGADLPVVETTFRQEIDPVSGQPVVVQIIRVAT